MWAWRSSFIGCFAMFRHCVLPLNFGVFVFLVPHLALKCGSRVEQAWSLEVRPFFRD